MADFTDADDKKPDTLVGIMTDYFQFSNERIHRERMPQPGDAERLTKLMNRQRAFA